MELHPIMYVADQYAERDFYKLLGFEHEYEGDEFPGFLAVRHGHAVIGLQRSSAEHQPYAGGLRWQFAVTEARELDQIISLCETHELQYDVELEVGGDRFRHRLLSVRSPAGVIVCFEGDDEPSDPDAG
jgi:hypothetical protein